MLSYISAAIVATSAFAAHSNPQGYTSAVIQALANPLAADQTNIYTGIDYSSGGSNWKGNCLDAVTSSSSQSPIDVITPVRATSLDTDSSQFSTAARNNMNLSPGTGAWGQHKAPRKTNQFSYDALVDYSWELNTFGGLDKPTMSFSSNFVDSSDNFSTLGSINRFNMHSPSEHKIDGAQYELEVNMEFAGNVSVRIFFDSTKGGAAQNDFVGSVFDAFRTREYEPESERLAIDFERLREAVDFTSFYAYNGSSTRLIADSTTNTAYTGSDSGCASGWNYIIIKDVQNISPAQMTEIQKYLPANSAGVGGKGNNRAVQPVAQSGTAVGSERKVYYKPHDLFINTQETKDASSTLLASAGALALAAALAF